MTTQLAQIDGPAPQPAPFLLRRQEGPFGELDLLAIGSVLIVVMAILGFRRLFRKRD
ncbi:MAG: hypothetical protein MPJ78_17970 [Hyphomicrobiaceae bacterium]|nr:hypothetical protein [Hyphomicrobiaceae bacterium]